MRLSPASVVVICEMSIVPFPMVDATAVPKTRKATKFQNAAQATANFGART